MPGGGGTRGSRTADEGAGSLYQLIRQGNGFSGHEPHRFYLNLGNEVAEGGARFADLSALSGFDFDDDGRALAVTDWDGDGDLDLWLTNRNAPQVRFLENRFPNKNHWIAFELEGTAANRDGIGARVELEVADALPQVQTLHAGSGYLSQSSKRLHFGLGEAPGKIIAATVFWPGGKAERFPLPPAVDCRYHLVQNSGIARPSSPVPKIELPRALTPPEHPPKPAGDTAAIRLVSNLPTPTWRYRTADGTPATIAPDNNFVLLNFWSERCATCDDELKAFAAAADALAEGKIALLALSVDNPAAKPEQLARLRARHANLALPYPTGIATDETLSLAYTLRDALFESRRSLPVPFSILLDPVGNAVAFYLGAVTPKRVIVDAQLTVESSAQSPAERYGHSLPFPGRWIAQPLSFGLVRYLQRLLELGYSDDVAAIATRRGTELSAYRNYPELLSEIGFACERAGDIDASLGWFVKAVAIRPDNPDGLANLGARYASANRPLKAEGYLRKALAIAPAHAEAKLNLAVLLLNTGGRREAGKLLAEILADDPEHVGAIANLGIMSAQAGNFPEAIAHFHRALTIDPASITAQFNLAQSLEASGQITDAIAEYIKALEIDKSHPRALQRVAWLSATRSDKDQRDPVLATDCAKRFAAVLGADHPNALECMAAASAASGDQKLAHEYYERAITSARAKGKEQMIPGLQSRAALYLQVGE